MVSKFDSIESANLTGFFEVSQFFGFIMLLISGFVSTHFRLIEAIPAINFLDALVILVFGEIGT
jgi:hypothetical protein